MTETAVFSIDELCWTATRYSDILKIDVRVVRQALETVSYRTIGKRQVWHVREGMPAIYRRVWGLAEAGDAINPAKLPPKDRLDHYKAERERIKLAGEVRALIPAAEVEAVVGEAFKELAQSLDSLPESLERDCGIAPETVMQAQRIMDQARDRLYEAVMNVKKTVVDT